MKLNRWLLFLAFIAGCHIYVKAQSVSSLKWSDVCMGKMNEEWYGTEEAQQIADVVLSVQKYNGGWMKNDQLHKLSDSERQALQGKRSEHSCLDNGATTQEMRFLAKVYQKTHLAKYKDSFLKALKMIFMAEKKCGGWSQYWPLSGNGSYQDYITFNDDLITNVMRLLQDIYAGKDEFSGIADNATRQHCEQSINRAIDVIIKCQVNDNGTPAAWCAQHDTITFLPTEGRPHELPSISGSESASLLSYLMTIENPSKELQHTIQTAVAWLDAHKIDRKAVENYVNDKGENDRRIIDKPGSAIWGRFIQLGGATGKETYDAFFTKLQTRGKSRSYSTDGKTYTYTEYEIATKSYNPDKAYQPIFAIYDNELQHLYYRFLYSYEDADSIKDWKGCVVPTSLNSTRRVKYQFMGSWPLHVINTEYPAWKLRMESQEDTKEYDTFVLSNETNTGSNTSGEYKFNGDISITNSNGKGYNTGSSNTVKYSAGVVYTVRLPMGMKIDKVRFYGYDNYAIDAYISSFNGVSYGTADYVFPAKDSNGNATFISYVLEAKSPIENSFTFSLGAKQCCLVMTLYQGKHTTNIMLPVGNREDSVVYNLQGIRQSNSAKGIYICNRRKILIK